MFQENQGNFTCSLAQFGRKITAFCESYSGKPGLWKNLSGLKVTKQQTQSRLNRKRREGGQERKSSSSAQGEKIFDFLLFLNCTAKFQACRSSVSFTIRYPVLWHYQSRSFLLVTRFPNELKETACLTSKGITPHFKACRSGVRGIKLCQSETLLKLKDSMWDTLVTLQRFLADIVLLLVIVLENSQMWWLLVIWGLLQVSCVV